MAEPISIAEAVHLLRTHAFTIEDEESSEHGRTIIHSRLGGIGADHDLDGAIEHVRRSSWRGYVPSIFGHNLGVEVEGRIYCYDVPLAPPPPPKQNDEGKRITQVWMAVAVDGDGDEGLPAASALVNGQHVAMPLVASDEQRRLLVVEKAREMVAMLPGGRIELRRFDGPYVVEEVIEHG